MDNVLGLVYWGSSIVFSWLLLQTIFKARVFSEELSKKVDNRYPYVAIFLSLPFLLIAEIWLYRTVVLADNEYANIILGLSIVFFIVSSFKIMKNEGEFLYWDHERKDGRKDNRYKDNDINVVPRSKRSKYLCDFYKYATALAIVGGVFIYKSDDAISVSQYQPKREIKAEKSLPAPRIEPKPETKIQQIQQEVKPQAQTVKRPDTSNTNIPLADLKFNEGLAVFEDSSTGLKGYVDGNGKVVIKPQFTGAGGFYQGRAVVKNTRNEWGYIDKSGNWVISPQFCMAGRFSEGLAAVYVGATRNANGDCVQGKWGFISVTGKMVIAPQFEQVWRFDRAKNEAAKAKVVLDGYTGYINGKGEWVD